jgi:RHH-type proline utilization regulon transcriptional repressor/proline dehydrogenase/delta 1-pyrroline-5-carboxylate dehydrogenase
MGFKSWSRTDPGARAAALDRAADLLEDRRDRFMALLVGEAGKTLDDGIAEIREAVDFLRYYAARSREMFSQMQPMPGPTGEENRLGWRGRGRVCVHFALEFPAGNLSLARSRPGLPPAMR